MKKKSALLVSITMVLVAVLALTTASFAWFTASMNPSVESFDVNVTTGEALLVSADGTTGFKTTLTSKELSVVKTNNLLQDAKDKLNAATPTKLDLNKKIELETATPIAKYKKGDIAFSKLKTTVLDTGIFDKDATKNYDDAFVTRPDPVKADGTTYRFIKFDIFFKASVSDNTKNIDVSLDIGAKNKTTYTGTEFYGIATANSTTKLGYTDTYQGQIAKVLRVAFVPVVGDNATIAANSDVAKVYEPDGNRLTEVGTDTVPPSATVTDTNHLVDSTLAMGADKIDLTTGIPKPQATNMPLFTLTAGKTAQMTVYIWIEGNDLDCVNEVSTAFFRSNIKFEGVRVTPSIP